MFQLCKRYAQLVGKFSRMQHFMFVWLNLFSNLFQAQAQINVEVKRKYGSFHNYFPRLILSFFLQQLQCPCFLSQGFCHSHQFFFVILFVIVFVIILSLSLSLSFSYFLVFFVIAFVIVFLLSLSLFLSLSLSLTLFRTHF